MTTKVEIDRAGQAVRIEVDEVIDAGWLGHDFVMRHRELAEQGWAIVCHRPGDLLVGPEVHILEGEVRLAITHDGPVWVDTIAEWIKESARHPYCSQCGHKKGQG